MEDRDEFRYGTNVE
jgi:hypothetical protein